MTGKWKACFERRNRENDSCTWIEWNLFGELASKDCVLAVMTPHLFQKSDGWMF